MPGATQGGTGDASTPGDNDAGPGDAATADVITKSKLDGGGRGEGGGAQEDAGSPDNTFSLINTNVNTIVYGEALYGYDPIPENSVIDLAQVGSALSIRANTTPTVVGSIGFDLDGTYLHTENAVPYVLCGDNGNGTINNCIQYLTPGKHVLTVTQNSAANLDGSAGPSSTLYFTITNSAGGTDAGGGG